MRRVIDVAWLVMSDRASAEAIADRTAIVSAALQSGDPQAALDSITVPTVNGHLDRLAALLADPAALNGPDVGDDFLEAVKARGR